MRSTVPLFEKVRKSSITKVKSRKISRKRGLNGYCRDIILKISDESKKDF